MMKHARNGAVLVTVLVLTMVIAIATAAVVGYVSHTTRMTAIATGRDLCRLAAQGEIELAKSAIYDIYRGTVGGGADVVAATINTAKNKGNKSTSAFDWFEAYSGTRPKRTIGTTGAITFDESVTVNGCTVRLRVGRVDHVAGSQYADVTLVAEAVRDNPGGSRSSSVVMETFRFSQQRAMVFDYAYFVNNYGWFTSSAVANGNVRSNGDMYLDSKTLINGEVFASANPELGVAGDITNYGQLADGKTYKRADYGTADRARPLSVKPGDGGYEAPEKKGNVSAMAAQARICGNQSTMVEMPYIGDLLTEESSYRAWAQAQHDADPSMSTIKQGGKTLATVVYDGVGPSGLAEVTLPKGGGTVVAPDYNAILLQGTLNNPIEINGPVIIPSDVIISGYVKGQGTIYSGRNIHIVGDIKYVEPPKWTGRSINRQDVVKRDMLGLMAKGNIVIGDYTQQSKWQNPVGDYMSKEPYVQQYACDVSDAAIGYPSTFGGNYMVEEYVSSSDFNNCANAGLASFVPGGYDASSGHFGKMVNVTVKNGGTSVVQKQVSYDRKYYESVCGNELIASLCTSLTRNPITQIDAVLYDNHGVFGTVGSCSINGSLVCRNEGIIHSGTIYFNWDVRLYSGCGETVDNDSVGLARGSDAAPRTLAWMELPQGIIEFD